MKISVNAPSYKRPSAVKTLAYLPFCRIWVDEGEAPEYRKNYPDAEIIACPKGVQGNTGRIRNYILREEFNRGMDVVLMVDDDLTCVERYNVRPGTNYGYEKHKITTEEFLPMVEKYSVMAKDLGAKLWGMNCNGDARAYRHYTPFSTLSFVGGPFQCFLKGNRCLYDERLPLKEDFDMTLQQLNLERVVLRVNFLHYICDQSKSPGRCAAYRNRDRERQQLDLLRKKWGSKIVQEDAGADDATEKLRIHDDYNPIIHVPIRGI